MGARPFAVSAGAGEWNLRTEKNIQQNITCGALRDVSYSFEVPVLAGIPTLSLSGVIRNAAAVDDVSYECFSF